MFKIIKIYIFFNLIVNIFILKVFAGEINITSTTGNQTVEDIYLQDGNLDTNNSTWLNITGNGYVNGSITNSNSNNPGHVIIGTNYNTINNQNSTTFGSSSSNLDYILVGNGFTLTASNQIFSDNIYLENSTIELNDEGNIKNISIFNNDINNKGNSTIIINTNYDNNTSFGYYQDDLINNVSISKMEITNGNSLTLNNYAYVDNITLNGNNANITLNDNSNIIGNLIGNVSGNGNVIINTNYNQEDTDFGSETNKLGSIQINNNKNLTIEATDAYQNNVYSNNILLNGSGSSLTIGDNGKIFGTISGTGNVIINTNYNGGADTIFGSSDSTKINNIQINSGNSLTLSNNAYVDNINISNNSSLEINNGAGITGNISGNGIVNINTNYTTSSTTTSGSYATQFGGGTKLQTLNINNASLTLGNSVYVNNLNLNNTSSQLNIESGGNINGIINDLTNGNATINLNTDYNTINNSTTFGTNGNSIGNLNIGNNSATLNFTLGNLAYINNVNLNTSNVIITNNGGLNGSFSGLGNITIEKNYTTTYETPNINNNEYNTEFGTSSSKIDTLNLNDGINLTLGTNTYLNSLNFGNNSTLTLNNGSAISGTIYGNSINSVININGIFNTSSLGENNNSYFGSNGQSISQLNINNNASLTLTTNSYINNINIVNSASYSGSTLALKADNSSITLNNINTISYDNINNIPVLISLKDTLSGGNTEFLNQVKNFLQLLNNNTNTSTNFTLTNNNLYFDTINKTESIGNKFLIDSNDDASYFSNATLLYETIFKDFNLQTEYNEETNKTDLYLVIKLDKTPTTNDVSESTITSSNIIDSWNFLNRTDNENILISNLQNITNRQDFFHAITNLSPNVSGLNVKIPTQSIISAIGNIDKRLSYFRNMKFISKTSNYNIKNLSRNDIEYYDDYFIKPYFENNFWMEGFTGILHQDTINNVFGYDADFYGATLGYDLRVNSNFIFGMSYTFNQTNANDIDYIKSSRDTLEAMTNNVDLYFMLYNKWNYLSLNLGGSYNKYNQERKINFYEFNKTAKSDYNGYSYYGEIEYGFNILLSKNKKTLNIEKKSKKINEKEQDSKNTDKKLKTYSIGEIKNFIMLTPKVSLMYNNIIIDDYTESGADAGNLFIKTKDYNSLDLNGGLSLTINKQLTDNITFRSALNGFLSYAIINNKVELDARYIEDDTTFKVYGIEPPNLTYNFGINFSFNFYEKFDINLGYDYTFGDGFNGMAGKIGFLLAF